MISETESITRKQHALITRLQQVESDIESLIRERSYLRAELTRIYPSARILVTPPKDKGTTLSIWNYAQNQRSCQIHTTPSGKKFVDDPNPTYMSDADLVILALCTRKGGANADKLLKLPQLLQLDANPRKRIHRLASTHFLDLEFLPLS